MNTIFSYMNMNLLAKTAEFERLCFNLSKRAQNWRINPETGKMEDTHPVPAASLSGPTPHYVVPTKVAPKPKAAPNMTVDPNMSKKPSLTTEVPAPQASEAPLQPGAHPDLEKVVKDTGNTPTTSAPGRSTPVQRAPVNQKPKQPPAWLTKYITKENTPAQPEPSVQKAIERSNRPLDIDSDRAAKEQSEQATKTNPFGK